MNQELRLPELIHALSQPEAYPYPVDHIEVHQTHISAVFLAGPYVYKVKKPVNLGFLDFSTLEKRKHFCEEEVRLNRRLAPDVYLGVVPITHENSAWGVEGHGQPIEWAVKMQRLPADATLESRLERGEVTAQQLADLAKQIADFHRTADRNEHIASFGRFDVVAGNIRENYAIAAAHIGQTVSAAVMERLRQRTEQVLDELCPLIEARAARSVPCDTHGDLHLDHVYLVPRPSPLASHLVIIDCIEFNERYRFADPVADAAFLAMDLKFHGRDDLAGAFLDAYFQAARDDEGRALAPLYISYRAAVRAKVEGIELSEKEIPEEERRDALRRGRAHWLLALGELEAPSRRPALVMVGGLPGTGKSILAKTLAEQAGFVVLRSDVVRKELAGLAPTDSGRAAFGAGIYGSEWTERTYAELLRRAEAILWEGGRVLIDASFRAEKRRQMFLELAQRWCVPALFLHCQADPATVRQRLAQRQGDASDADWEIYLQAATAWEELTQQTRVATALVSCEGTLDETISIALSCMRRHNLFE